MKLAKELAKEAKRKGICEPWYKELKTLEDKRAMVAMYVKGIDFCLSNDYPTNDYIRANFKGIMEDFGVFLDDQINLVNYKRCVALGTTKGRVEVGSFGVSGIFAKHESELAIIAKDDAFVMIDLFDDATLHIHAQDRAKVCVNRYGGTLVADPINDGDSARVKIIEKHKKTY